LFTGIVTGVGRIIAVEPGESGSRLEVGSLSGDIDFSSARKGDSVAVAGVCLTMLNPSENGFEADISAETLAATSLGAKQEGTAVNLELALKAGDRLGGHMVSGHVDAAVRLLSRYSEDNAVRMEFELPAHLSRYVSRKGSVCLDGVSLTVNAVSENTFSVCIIPHSLDATTLGSLQDGDRVNIEVDMIARYLESLIQDKGQ
jgi:riboflavin synthase